MPPLTVLPCSPRPLRNTDPVPAEHADEWLTLPSRYEEAFGRKLPEDSRTRSATRLHWVRLEKKGPQVKKRPHPEAYTEAEADDSDDEAELFENEGSLGLGPVSEEDTRSGKWALLPVVHECAISKEECARRCNVRECRVQTLPLKRELAGALAAFTSLIGRVYP